MEQWPAETDRIGVWLEDVHLRPELVLYSELEHRHLEPCLNRTKQCGRGQGHPFILEELPGIEKQGNWIVVPGEQVGTMAAWQPATISVYRYRRR